MYVYMEYKTILVDMETYNMLKELKEKEKKSFNQLLKEILREYIKMKKRKLLEELVKLIEEDKKWESVEEFLKERRKTKWFRY